MENNIKLDRLIIPVYINEKIVFGYACYYRRWFFDGKSN